jgi:3-deoxy-D-manno-octulosonate 8-phosphate phosphatase (KDO 8-P phosphatase)
MQPALTFAPELLLRAQGPGLGLRAAIFDVDGVLTDGSLYIGDAGEVFKAFSVLDGQGLKRLAQGGIVPIVITGRDSAAARRRVADLGLPHAAFGASDKVAAANDILQTLGIEWEDVAVIGDDWPDLPLFANAGFACAPANAHAEALGAAHHVTTREGGRGAAREFCDLLLMANGLYVPLMSKLLVTLDSK